MKLLLSTFIFPTLILLFGVFPAYGQVYSSSLNDPSVDPAVEIIDMELKGNPVRGATVQLQVQFKAYVDGRGEATLHFPKDLAPPNRRTGETHRMEQIDLEKEKTYVKNYTLRVEESGSAMIEFILSVPEAPVGYARSTSEHINVDSGSDSYQVFAPGDTTRHRVSAMRGAIGNTGARTQSTTTVSVSGDVNFIDQNQSRIEGLYGTKIKLWFRNSNNPDQLYHPVLGDSEHVHYDRVEEDGSYHFNFSFTRDISEYDQLLILVGTSNRAATLSVEQGAWIVDDGDGTESFFGLQQGILYDINGMGPNISISNADATVNSKDGAILRNIMLS